ncbi:MAG: hypothetical protein AB7L65_06345, partial [Hyphomonadaceae bacterium]
MAWAGAGAGVLAAALAIGQLPLAAALAFAAGAASALLAWNARAPRPSNGTRAARESPAKGLAELAPLLEALPDPALLIDKEGRVAGANLAARRQFDFDAPGARLSSILRQPDLLDAAHAAAHE